MKHIYPAKFIKEKDGYIVDFIDFPCTTQGETLEEAIEMAKDAMGLYLEDFDSSALPKATIPFSAITLSENEFISLIELDINHYRKKYGNKAVRKTLTIPSWLNKIAEDKNVNFSQTLQKALKEKLGIDD